MEEEVKKEKKKKTEKEKKKLTRKQININFFSYEETCKDKT
jgi:hypothetical protein